MQARPGPAYRPEDFRRGYSREQIAHHLDECLELYAELDERHEINPAIAPAVFATVQTMVSAVEPTEEALKAAQTRAQLASGNGDGISLGLTGRR